MHTGSFTHRYIVMASLWLLVSNADAMDCKAVSPNVRSVNDAWSSIPTQNLDQDLSDKLVNYLLELVGEWEGTGEAMECIEFGNAVEARKNPQKLKLRMSQSQAKQFSFNIDVQDLKNKIRTLSEFSITRSDQGIQVPGEGAVALMSLSGSVVKFRTQTLLLANAVTGSALPSTSRETVREISLHNDKLHLTTEVYHNGVLIEFSDWVFSKR